MLRGIAQPKGPAPATVSINRDDAGGLCPPGLAGVQEPTGRTSNRLVKRAEYYCLLSAESRPTQRVLRVMGGILEVQAHPPS
jgi:hypothetical protein